MPADPAHPPPADLLLSRRQFFGRTSAGIGGAALASLLNPGLLSAAGGSRRAEPASAGGSRPWIHSALRGRAGALSPSAERLQERAENVRFGHC